MPRRLLSARVGFLQDLGAVVRRLVRSPVGENEHF
jgi:hypothetical protein